MRVYITKETKKVLRRKRRTKRQHAQVGPGARLILMEQQRLPVGGERMVEPEKTDPLPAADSLRTIPADFIPIQTRTPLRPSSVSAH